MASRVLKRRIAVFAPASTPRAYGGAGASPALQHIITYGEEDEEAKKGAPVHVLWSGNHYDALVPSLASGDAEE
jgi:hypothetical protein